MSTIKALNVNHPNHRENLKEEKYTIIREAILAVLPAVGDSAGISFPDLEEKVRSYLLDKRVSMDLFPKPGSVRWYTKSVQLDLEARQMIERIPNKRPLRFRKSV